MVRDKLKACSPIRTLICTGTLLPVLAIGIALWFSESREDQGAVSAFAVNLPDADDDGTRDEFEDSMFTDKDVWDTDGDTWSDSEEFAMRSNPGNAGRFPVSIPRHSTNLTARGENGRLHVLSTAYFMDASNAAGAQFSLGLLIGRRYRKFSSNYLAINGESHSVAARPYGAKVAFFEISFPDTILSPGQRATFLAMLTMPGANKPSIVTSLDVVKDASGVLIMEYPTGMMPNQPGSTNPLPSGSIYLPIPTSTGGGGGSVPTNWTPAQLCLKRTQTVGRMGALMTQQVVSADCVVGFEGYCDVTLCADTVTTTFQTVDPLVLAGAQ